MNEFMIPESLRANKRFVKVHIIQDAIEQPLGLQFMGRLSLVRFWFLFVSKKMPSNDETPQGSPELIDLVNVTSKSSA